MSNKVPSPAALRGVLVHPEIPQAAPASPSLAGCIAPEPRRAASTSSGAAPVLSDDTTWRPRIGASHLCLGANRIWYMRLVVPAHIRARHPELPKELKRSTKVTQKSLALAQAQKMCLDFFVKYTTGASMLTLDEKHDQSFALFYENGKVRIDHSHSASAETLTLMTRCFERMMLQVVGRGQRPAIDQLPAGAPIAALALPPAVAPSPQPAAYLAAAPNASEPGKILWLSDAIDEWRLNGGTKFSDLSWRHSYEASFGVFRELVSDTRRDRIAQDETPEFGILDIELHRLTRRHIEALHDGLKRLPANQGRNTKDTEAHERIRQGAAAKAKWPSLSSVDKKLGHIAPFITHASHKNWINAEVLSEILLATKSATANLIKAEKKTTQKKGAVALSDF